MRLLKINDSQELSFTKYYIGEAPPPYAILSHTWGTEDDEVTFKDIASGTGKGKKGYRKINFCRKQALQDELTHFWIDSCCIDKTNLAELSETINSMFRLYANANRCYAYLSDVSRPFIEGSEERDREAWKPDVKKSRWFTRGWTLQELLAPASVEFFSQEGNRIGSKDSLEALICETTKIPPAALRGLIADFPMEQRISWQGGRSTTREEDEAYSLLGICNIYLPLIYGEGKENAFRRLRRELPLVEINTPHSLEKLNSLGSRMLRFANQLTRNNDSARAQEILDRLSTYQPLKTLNRIQSKRLDGTTEWLTENETFTYWKSSRTPGECLWLSGKIGSGKTVAMATAIQHLVVEDKQNQGMQILHYFFEYPYIRSMDLFCSVSKQLIQNLIARNEECPTEAVEQLDASFGDRNRIPDLQDVIDYILTPLITRHQTITLCIDGIDECDFEEQRKIRDGLHRISRQVHLKLLLSSEDETKIPSLSMNAVLRIRLDGSSPLQGIDSSAKGPISQDIETYIEAQLHELSGPDQLFGDMELRERVKSELIAKSNCMFLWVYLQVESLAACETPAEVISVLNNLPPTLNETYIRCLMRKKGSKLLCNPKVLKWATAAKEPIAVDQLREMLSVNLQTGKCQADNMPSVESVKHSAVSLLSFEGYARISVPTHHSVRQFLFSRSLHAELTKQSVDFDNSTLDELTLSMESTILEIGRISLLHIKSRTGLYVEKQQHLETPPIHAMIPTGVRKVLGLRPQAPRQISLPSYRHSVPESHENDFLQYSIRTWTAHTKEITSQASFWEDFRQVALQPNMSWNVHPWSSMGGTETSHLRGLLGFAVSHNHVPLLQILADHTALQPDVYDHVLPGNGLLPALHVAAEAGSTEIVRILLQFCKVNALSPQLARTALHFAAYHGHEDVAVLLCKAKGVNVDMRDREGCSPLHLAAAHGHGTIVKTLLKSKIVDPNAKDNDGYTALHWAASYSNDAAVTALLECEKVDPNAKDKQGCTALYWAASYSRDAIVKALLGCEKVNANARDNEGQTALHWAATANSHKTTIKALLGKVDANAKDKNNWTALHWTAVKGYEAVVRALLESGKVDANAKDEYGFTALFWAAINSYEATVKALLEFEQVDVNIKNKYGETVLCRAIDNGNEATIKALLASERIDSNAKDNDGETALHRAAVNGCEEMVKVLLESKKVDINAKNNDNKTALQLATKRKQKGIVAILNKTRD